MSLAEVTHFLSERIQAAHAAGIADVIIDPGFGFGKTTAHNYALLNGLGHLRRSEDRCWSGFRVSG